MFYSLCYPTLSEEDNDFIKSFRKNHDLPFKDVVAHHFTIAFGISDIDRKEYSTQVKKIATKTKVINFTCRYAMIGNDDSNDNFYVFLVPDDGFSNISLLHDHIYEGALEPFHRSDIPYIPHIGIGTLTDSNQIKGLCTELNKTDLRITGKLEGVTICEYDGKFIKDLEYVRFSA